MAMTTGFMAGATIVFSIPVGLAMLEQKDHKQMDLTANMLNKQNNQDQGFKIIIQVVVILVLIYLQPNHI